MKEKTSKIKWVLPLLISFSFLLGIGLLLYPTVSAYINLMNQTRATVGYAQSISNITEEEKQAIRDSAVAFNERILNRRNIYALSESDKQEYEHMLSVTGSKLIGYVEVPTADATLPIYRGTGASALQRGAGHLEWTSLPVGGPSTHSVLTSHRGSPSAILFTHLTNVVIGDRFMVHVLGDVLTYEVDQINTVLPSETEKLLIERDMDLCTLITCTPYGVNTHRLLVRGHRVENDELAVKVHLVSEAIMVDEKIVAVFIVIPLVLIVILRSMLSGGKRRRI